MAFQFFSENMVRGLDGDETVFLDMVAKQQEQLASRRFDEESQEIKEYRVGLVFNTWCCLCEPTVWTVRLTVGHSVTWFLV